LTPAGERPIYFLCVVLALEAHVDPPPGIFLFGEADLLEILFSKLANQCEISSEC
jgi:hypothetical protein